MIAVFIYSMSNEVIQFEILYSHSVNCIVSILWQFVLDSLVYLKVKLSKHELSCTGTSSSSLVRVRSCELEILSKTLDMEIALPLSVG